MKKWIAGASIVAAGVSIGGTAFAGERGGNGEPTPINEYRANSICSFSGLDDMDFEAPVDPGVVQNWGSIPKFVRDTVLIPMGEHPGTACNGHLNGLHG